MLYYKLYRNKLHDINQKIDKIINLIEPTKGITIQISKRSYLPGVEKLWKNFKKLLDKTARLDPNFSFNQMATEIRKLCEERGITASTLKIFYKQKTTPKRSTLKVIEEWMDRNKEIDDSDNIIHNSDSKEDNEI
jgi:hypothetical protein